MFLKGRRCLQKGPECNVATSGWAYHAMVAAMLNIVVNDLRMADHVLYVLTLIVDHHGYAQRAYSGSKSMTNGRRLQFMKTPLRILFLVAVESETES